MDGEGMGGGEIVCVKISEGTENGAKERKRGTLFVSPFGDASYSPSALPDHNTTN